MSMSMSQKYMYAESSNDEYKGYAQIATQRDFDAF